MREADPDDPIFKMGYVIGEKRLRNSPQDPKKKGKAEKRGTGTRRKQIEKKRRPINKPYAD